MLPLVAIFLAAAPAGAFLVIARRGDRMLREYHAMLREAADRQAKREAAERWAAWRPHRLPMPCHDASPAAGNASIMGGCAD